MKSVSTQALEHLSYGIYVVTSGREDQKHSMVATWLMQVSFDPPLVALSIERDSAFRLLLDRTGAFTVSSLSAAGVEVGKYVLRHGKLPWEVGSDSDKEKTRGKRGEGKNHEQLLSAIECKISDTLDAGDHILYIGKVESAKVFRDDEPLTQRQTGWKYRRNASRPPQQS